jgi:hypothetical protein
VSGLTLPQLLSADPAPFRRAATAWVGLAEDLDNVAEQLIRDTRTLEHAWPSGPAADAAHAKAGAVRAEVSNAYQPARRIAQALSHHAEALSDLRGQAQEIAATARRAGYIVDAAAATVTASRAAFGGSMDSMLANSASITGHAQRYADDLATLLGRARDLDDHTTNTINANLPDPRTGFGQLSLPAISRQDVADQRGRPPKDVNAWWRSLTPEQQEQTIHDHPDLVGWLNGVPTTDRDTANRLALSRHQNDLRAREDQINARLTFLTTNHGGTETERWVTGQDITQLRGELASIDAQQATLTKVDTTLGRLGDKGMLLGLDPTGDGKAIVAVGNPDTVRHTAVWVPGLGTELADISGNVTRVQNIQRAADELTPEPNDVATIMWLGYDAPELDLSVAAEERSRQGGAVLAPFVDGLRATHDTGTYHVTAIGHSYGSTVIAEAALRGSGLRVDDIVTAGSPGMHTEHATNLGMPPGHVWSGASADDMVAEPIATHGKYGVAVPVVGPWLVDAYDDAHGISPHEQEFGANQYHVDTSGHSGYWAEGSESLDNQARVVVGHYADVSLDHGQRPANWQG